MKLCRIGNVGEEKPAIIDEENNFRDLSSLIEDFNPDTLNFSTIDKIQKSDISNLPKLDQILELVHVYQNHLNLLE
jgi:hypothetical protein